MFVRSWPWEFFCWRKGLFSFVWTLVCFLFHPGCQGTQSQICSLLLAVRQVPVTCLLGISL